MGNAFFEAKAHTVQPDLFSRGPRGTRRSWLPIITLKREETVSVEVNGNRVRLIRDQIQRIGFKPKTYSKLRQLREKIVTYRWTHQTSSTWMTRGSWVTLLIQIYWWDKIASFMPANVLTSTKRMKEWRRKSARLSHQRRCTFSPLSPAPPGGPRSPLIPCGERERKITRDVTSQEESIHLKNYLSEQTETLNCRTSKT